MSLEQIKAQAKLLAKENKSADPGIERVYWFPNEHEVRLVELMADLPASGGSVEPFYFRASPQTHLHAPTGIALIRPEEYRHLTLPKSWGSWDEGEELSSEELSED